MNKSTTIGILGGYGSTGSVVVEELLKSTEYPLLVGGRNLEKAQQISQKNSARITARYTDVFQAKTLSDFCQQCAIVINCTGPGYHILNRVALAAIANKCHYIDTSGEEQVLDSLADRQHEIKQENLVCLLSAGWMPGLSEVLPIYADNLAHQKFDSVNSLELYFADASDWSTTGTIDQLEFLFQNRSGISLFFKQYIKQWKQKDIAIKKAKSVILPNPLGKQKVYLCYFENIKKFVAKTNYPIESYIAWLNWQTFATVLYLRLFFKPTHSKAQQIFKRLYVKNHKKRGGNGGFIVATVNGQSQGKKQKLTVSLFERRHYWLTGVVPATAARMILENKISATGCHYLGEAVNAVDFMQELAKVGVKHDVFLENY